MSKIAISQMPGKDPVKTVDPATINHIPGSAMRYASLDAIRGLAAVSILLFHTSWPAHPAATTFARNCYTAVDLFFMLSGFVIAASYQTKVATRQQVVSFFERRIFRVYPLHLAVIGWLAALELAKLAVRHHGGNLAVNPAHPAFTGSHSVALLIVNVLFIQGTGLFLETGWNPPSWSVSAELAAYVIFAITGYLGLLRKPLFIASAAICGFLTYIILAWTRDSLDVTTDLGIIRCLAGFPIGVALYQLTSNGSFTALKRLSANVTSLLEALAVLSLGLVLEFADGGWIVLTIPCFIVVLLLFQMERGLISRALLARPFQLLGAISYSIYLIHVPIRNLIVAAAQYAGVHSHHTIDDRTILDVSPNVGDGLLALFIITTLALAVLTFRFIEEPARLFGRRLSAQPSKL